MSHIQEQFTKGIVSNKVAPSLLEILLPGGTLKDGQAALSVYQKAYKATLTEALGETYEGVWSVVGDDVFFSLAESYIKKHPSYSYDLSHYGQDFANFLEEEDCNNSYPFLPDLARFEWVFKKIFHTSAPTARIAFDSATPRSVIHFLPSIEILACKFSVHEIWQRRKDQLSEVPEAIDMDQFLLVFKGMDRKVWVVPLEQWQFDLYLYLFQENSIEDSLDKILSIYPTVEPSSLQTFFTTLATYPLVRDLI